MKTTAIILSAGKGKRMNSDISKQYIMLEGYPLIYHTIKAFEDSEVDNIVLVAGKDEIEFCKTDIISRYGFKKVRCVTAGGKERYNSVYEGLKAIENNKIDTDIVLVHDGARAFVNDKIIHDSIRYAHEFGAAVAAVKAKDTIKLVCENGFVKDTPDRNFLWQIQTPQTFLMKSLKKAYDLALDSNDEDITDDSMIMERYGDTDIKVFEASYDNIKVTTPEDLIFGRAILNNRKK